MKKLTTAMALVTPWMMSNGQSYVFNHFTAPYERLDLDSCDFLIDDTVMLLDQFADIELPFPFTLSGDLIDSAIVRVDGIVGFIGACGHSGPLTAAGFFSDFDDRGFYQGSSDSSISSLKAQLTGTPGTRIYKIEYENMGLGLGDWDDYVNFQLWLYEASSIFEIRFGSGYVNPDNWGFGEDGPMCLFTYRQDCVIPIDSIELIAVIADPNDPTAVWHDDVLQSLPDYTLDGVPDSSTVYQFRPQGIGMLRNESSVLAVLPNPTSGPVTITLPNPLNQETQFVVTNFLGQVVRNETVPAGSLRFGTDLSQLPSGLYQINLVGKERLAVGKVVLFGK